MSTTRQDWTRRIKTFLKDLRGPWAYAQRSWAQEGEDLVLQRIFGKRRDGYYVDIGCHHPHRFSNTYAFYRRGWRGLCIDPLPGIAAPFRRWRPRDVVLEMGVGAEVGELVFHRFNEPALSTFSEALAREREGRNNWRVVERRAVPVRPLATLLAQHLPAGMTEFDLLSVDVEGLDLEVLRSNDWTRFRPRVIVAECLETSMMRWQDDPVMVLLRGAGYFPVAKTGHSVFFLRDSDDIASVQR